DLGHTPRPMNLAVDHRAPVHQEQKLRKPEQAEKHGDQRQPVIKIRETEGSTRESGHAVGADERNEKPENGDEEPFPEIAAGHQAHHRQSEGADQKHFGRAEAESEVADDRGDDYRSDGTEKASDR